MRNLAVVLVLTMTFCLAAQAREITSAEGEDGSLPLCSSVASEGEQPQLPISVARSRGFAWYNGGEDTYRLYAFRISTEPLRGHLILAGYKYLLGDIEISNTEVEVEASDGETITVEKPQSVSAAILSPASDPSSEGNPELEEVGYLEVEIELKPVGYTDRPVAIGTIEVEIAEGEEDSETVSHAIWGSFFGGKSKAHLMGRSNLGADADEAEDDQTADSVEGGF